MLSGLPAIAQFDVSVLATALAWLVGFRVALRRWPVFQSLAIGCFVCLIGYTVSSFGAPAWLIVAAPIPFDIVLQWYVVRRWRRIPISYLTTWAVYVLLHVVLSATIRYDYLIPPWHLHG